MTTFFYQQAWNFLDLTRMASVISGEVKKLWLDRQKRDTVNYSAAVIWPNAKLAKVAEYFPHYFRNYLQIIRAIKYRRC